MERGREMAIGVECQPDGVVPEQVLHDLWVRPRLEQNACGRVPKVMNANVWKASLPECLGEGTVHLAGFERAAFKVGKDQCTVEPFFCF